MRSGTGSGRTNIAYQLALCHAGAGLYTLGKTRQMHIRTFISVHMPYLDTVSSAGPVPATEGNAAVAYGVYRCSFRSSIIHSCMGPDLACHRMLAAVGESAAYAVKFQRGLEEGFAQALARLAPIF